MPILGFRMEVSYTISVARTLAEVEALRSVWGGWQVHPNADLDFYRLILRHRKHIQGPYVVVLRANDVPAALLVGRAESGVHPINLGYLKLAKVSLRAITFVTGGIMGTMPPEAVPAVLAHLQGELSGGKADIVRLSNLRTDSALFELATRSPAWFCRGRDSTPTRHWTMQIPDKAEAFFSRMSKKHRYWVRRMQKQLEDKFPGKIQYKCFQKPQEIQDCCQAAESIARTTYQRGIGAGFVANDETLEQFQSKAADGRLRAYFLYIEDEPKAFWIGEICKGAFHASTTGYDPQLREYELGTLLFVHAVIALGEEGVAQFDFGLGDALYKQRFGDASYEEDTVSVFAPSLKPIAVNLVSAATAGLGRIGRRILERFALVERVKKRWRRRLANGLAQVPPGK